TKRSLETSAAENLRYPDAVRCGWIKPSDSRNRILEIVTSGKSGRSAWSTAPIDRVAPIDRAGPPGDSPGTGSALRSAEVTHRTSHRWRLPHAPLTTDHPGQEHQPELSDLHLVAAGQYGVVHRLTVDVGAVEAADVHDDEIAPLAAELRMPAGDGDVVE